MDDYQYSSQNEVSFIEGIAPQYVQCCQIFIITRRADQGMMKVQRRLIQNHNYAPWSYFKVEIPTSFSMPNK